jgi:hypothetical protein
MVSLVLNANKVCGLTMLVRLFSRVFLISYAASDKGRVKLYIRLLRLPEICHSQGCTELGENKQRSVGGRLPAYA